MSFLSSLGKTNVGRTLQSNLKGLLSSIGACGSLGSLGDVVFEVSSSTVRTIDNLAHNTKARLAKHDIIGKKPVMEFLGPDGDEVSFDMRFSIYLGINPKEEADKLRKMCEKGEAMELIMGNQPIGAGKWVIESVSESVDAIDNLGNILVSTVKVSLKEYPEEVET